jgi:hypothetical protein
MSKMKSPWREAGDITLADGEWHDREEVAANMMAVIPPGMAVRRRVRVRDSQAAVKGYATSRPTPVDKQIRRGQRSIAIQSINNACADGKWQYNDDRSRVRLTPL